MKKVLLGFSLLCLSGVQVSLAQGSAEEGESVFRKCRSCHQVGPNARNAVGPVLNGVIGRAAGSAEGYQYSTLNKSAGSSGLVWTEELIFNYLADPSAFLKAFIVSSGKGESTDGATKMVFKLPDEDERRDVIAYLKTFSPQK